MRTPYYLEGMLFLLAMLSPAAQALDYPIEPLPFTAVQVEDDFWSPRLATNRTVTIPYCFRKCEETGRIDNFAKAGGLMAGEFQGIRYDDSDVYKVIEGAAYSLAVHSDPELDGYLDRLIAKIAAAQEDDGYLYTCRTIDPGKLPPAAGETRWSHLEHSHELYNVGHLYEAAVAHFQATGKRTLLEVALRNAELVWRVFGPGPDTLDAVPGHQEIEIGLCKLARVTGERRYLELAKLFLERRGRGRGPQRGNAYAQDHLPVVEQRQAVGHAVRAGYMYSAMADVAALTGDAAFLGALDRLWADVVEGKTYLTGGIGARRSGEAFGDAFELPHDGYNETCAAIANALWNHRMFLLHGDAQYLDVLERILYNGFLAGVSLDGELFFYPNPLACDGRSKFNQGTLGRSPWFDCSCCPVNVARFLPSVPGFAYARRGDALFVNLFMGGATDLQVAGQAVRVHQETRYPWDGKVAIQLELESPLSFELRLRVPGWARGVPMPGGLYSYLDAAAAPVVLRVNGQAAALDLRQGFAVLRRSWQAGDRVELELPLVPRRVVTRPEVAANRGRAALERGPIVYCLEGADHPQELNDVYLPDAAALITEHRADLLGGVTLIRAAAPGQDLQAVPYYAWAHRGAGTMAVWMARARPARPAPTLASQARISASHCWAGDSLEAVNDQREPRSSIDHELPRFTWWDRRGGAEWLQMDFAGPAAVNAVEVYWFDDRGLGQCRVPAEWRLSYRDGEEWRPVRALGSFGTLPDRYNVLRFAPVQTGALRLDVRLQEGFSGGVLEWRVQAADARVPDPPHVIY